jgi:folate-binding protein YgfZ
MDTFIMQSFYASLNAAELLEVSGEDSRKFLQGQLTCELDKIPVGSMSFGAACNNKGRVYSNFRILHQENRFLLSMQPGILTITMQALQKYIPFYKADMADASGQFNRIALAGDDAAELLKGISPALPEKNQSANIEGALLINISDHCPRYELWLKPGQDHPFDQILATLARKEKTAWDALDHEAGIVFIHPQESSLYTPEELNLDLAGFVSFSKGCYTGQEIVARMHYRGKANKRLHTVTLESPETPTDNVLYNSSQKALGSVINLLNIKDYIYNGFVVIKTGTDLRERFWLGDQKDEIAAEIRPLQYQ